MTDAEKAYQAAQEKIARVRKAGEGALTLNGEAFRALEVIPPEIAELDRVRQLFLSQTQVSDLSPLANMTALESLTLYQTQVSDLSPLANMTALESLNLYQTQVSDLSPLANMTTLEMLDLNDTQVSDLSHLVNMTALKLLYLAQTQVSDLSPLANMTALESLDLTQTQVHDLRPIQNLTKLENDGFLNGLRFTNTPFAHATPETTRLAAIKDNRQRTRETLAFLRTLPPYPEPLPWDVPAHETQTAQAQIDFVLSHAVNSQISAQDTAHQIRFALRDVPATDGNMLPPPLQSMLDVADILDRLGRAPITPENPNREAELKRRLAELEQQVKTLTEQLSDSEQARKAAEAKAADNGFWANYKASTGKTIGYGQFLVAGTGIAGGLIYFLGPQHPLVQALLSSAGK